VKGLRPPSRARWPSLVLKTTSMHRAPVGSGSGKGEGDILRSLKGLLERSISLRYYRSSGVHLEPLVAAESALSLARRLGPSRRLPCGSHPSEQQSRRRAGRQRSSSGDSASRSVLQILALLIAAIILPVTLHRRIRNGTRLHASLKQVRCLPLPSKVRQLSAAKPITHEAGYVSPRHGPEGCFHPHH
jgi:hypothetical protein